MPNNVNIKNCIIYDFGEGIFVEGNETHLVNGTIIDNCTIYDNTNINSGIHLQYTNNTLIKDSNIYSHQTGINADYSDYLTIENSEIYNSTSTNIIIGNSNYVSVIGNEIYNSASELILLGDIVPLGKANYYGVDISNSDYFELLENNIYGNSFGLYIESSHNGSIDSNNVYDNLHGIYFYISSNNSISNNHIYLNNYYESSSCGIKIVGEADTYSENNIISNNLIEKNSIGIEVWDGEGTIITGNLINNNVEREAIGSGIDLYTNNLTSYYIEITENEMCGNYLYGILVDFADGLIPTSVLLGFSEPYPIIENNTFCVSLVSPRNDYIFGSQVEVLLQEIIPGTEFEFDFSNMLMYDDVIFADGEVVSLDVPPNTAYDAGLTGNCTLYIDDEINQTVFYWDNITYDFGSTYVFPVLYLDESNSHTWQVKCEDNWGNNGISPLYKLLSNDYAEMDKDSSYNDTNRNESVEFDFEPLGVKINMTTFCNDEGNIYVTRFTSNPSGKSLGVRELGEYFSFTHDFNCFEEAIVKIYYEEENLPAGVNEENLKIYYYNTETSTWIPYNSPNGGVNIEENYVWARTTHFTLFASGGVVVSGSSSSSSSSEKDELNYEYEVTCPDNKLTVYVKSENQSLEDAMVIVYRNGVYYNSGRTNNEGLVTFTLTSSSGDYRIKVSKSGYELPDSSTFTHTLCTIVIPPECMIDSDCISTKYCSEGNCVDVTGVCGYIENHKWVSYECCEDSDCALGYECTDNTCVLIPVEEPEEEVIEEEPDEEIVEEQPVEEEIIEEEIITEPEVEKQEYSGLMTILLIIFGFVIVGVILKKYLLNKN